MERIYGMTRRLALALLMAGLAATTAVSDAEAATESTCRSYLATNPNPSGIPALSGPGAAQRSALLADGGKLVAIGGAYYTVWVPPAFYTASRPVVVFDLHGTAGYPEAEWNDWHAALAARGYAFIGLSWGGGTPSAATDETIYTQLKQIAADVAVSCPFGGADKWLMGFSVGSAMSFAVMVRDVADQHLFRGQVAMSGAAIEPYTSGSSAMHATVEAARSNGHAVLGIRSWMYCGELEVAQGWSMCADMSNAESFVDSHGGSAYLYRDAGGSHHSLPTNVAAYEDMFGYIGATSSGTCGSDPEVLVHRYRNTQILGHFYTTSTTEGTALISAGAPLQYEGVAFTGCSGGSTSSGVYPVYRFKSLTQSGVYFYSMLPPEIDSVRTNLSSILKDEGIAYYAFNATATGRYPIYRFRNAYVTGANFYTIMEEERANVIATVPGYPQEGIGFYAMPPR